MNESTPPHSRLSLTQARRLLPGLIHELELHPDRVFHIFRRDRPVAELQAPPQVARKGLAAQRLLKLAQAAPRRGPASGRVSEDTDRHVY
ncbi:MAG: hypothetical protein NTY77_20395 [Elusimicrobia bacterium]|nr:hypothetical protein [Elusimicrobiota bacterium]